MLIAPTEEITQIDRRLDVIAPTVALELGDPTDLENDKLFSPDLNAMGFGLTPLRSSKLQSEEFDSGIVVPIAQHARSHNK